MRVPQREYNKIKRALHLSSSLARATLFMPALGHKINIFLTLCDILYILAYAGQLYLGKFEVSLGKVAFSRVTDFTMMQ